MVAGWTAGCGPPANREDLVKEVLKADPDFTAPLEKHDDYARRIKVHEQELEVTRTTIERKIAQLRKDLTTAVSSTDAKIADVKKKMEPDRQRLQLALSEAAQELSAKRIQRASLGRSIAELRKATRNPNVQWTAKERMRQDEKIEEMTRDAARLDQEMAALKAHVRLLKIKLLLIKF